MQGFREALGPENHDPLWALVAIGGLLPTSLLSSHSFQMSKVPSLTRYHSTLPFLGCAGTCVVGLQVSACL